MRLPAALALLSSLLSVACCRKGPPEGPTAQVRIENRTGKKMTSVSLGIQSETVNYTTTFSPLAPGETGRYESICTGAQGCYSRASFQLEGMGWKNPAHYPPSTDTLDKKVPRVLSGSSLPELRPGGRYTFSYRLVGNDAVATVREDAPSK